MPGFQAGSAPFALQEPLSELLQMKLQNRIWKRKQVLRIARMTLCCSLFPFNRWLIIFRASGDLLGFSLGRDGESMPSPRTWAEQRKNFSTYETKNRGFHLAQNVGERKFWQGTILYVGFYGPDERSWEAKLWPAKLSWWDENQALGVQREACWAGTVMWCDGC